VAQIGQERGGFYSYDFLENLVGLNIHSVDKIIPEYQHDEKSPGLKLAPKVPPLPVACIEPERTLAFGGWVDPNTPSSWLFFMEDAGENRTRLISRWRFSYKPSIGFRIGFGVIVQSIACVMQRKMLLGIKKRADRVFKGAEDPGKGGARCRSLCSGGDSTKAEQVICQLLPHRCCISGRSCGAEVTMGRTFRLDFSLLEVLYSSK
jgi:hypothetical protein